MPLERVLSAAMTILVAAGMALPYARADLPTQITQHHKGQHTLPDWRLMFDMTEIQACQAEHDLGDCVLGIVEPDKQFLNSYCGGKNPYGYEIRAGDADPADPREPTAVVFCKAEDYTEAQDSGEIERPDPILELILPVPDRQPTP